MRIYLFTAGVQSDELITLEARLRSKLPSLQILIKLDELIRRAAERTPVPPSDKVFVIFPILAEAASLDGLIGAAEQEHPGIFFIFVSKEISASDYKRLVRNHDADWVSLQGAPEEIEEIISRGSRTETTGGAVGVKPIIVAFVASSGGVGNSTLALETAVQIKRDKKTRERRVCVLDLDLETSHVCDYLDIEPRLQMREIVNDPSRLDGQLFELFVSHHSSGVDVIASPRSRQDPLQLNLGALEALFGMIARRYDLLMVDLPPQWSLWTPQIVSVCDLAVVSGLNTVPGLRQVASTLEAVRTVERVPSQITVVLNRCESGLFGGIARSQHIKRILSHETVITVRDDVVAAVESVNTGIPISLASPSSKIAKDIRPLANLLAGVTATTA
jgi:pilus assembly protein CpaE